MSQASQNPNTTAHYRQPAAASLDRFHNDDNGVETEKGLATLLEDPTAVEVLGLDLVFELPAVLTQQKAGTSATPSHTGERSRRLRPARGSWASGVRAGLA
jgi:hypothetical protein